MDTGIRDSDFWSILVWNHYQEKDVSYMYCVAYYIYLFKGVEVNSQGKKDS